MIWRQTIVTFDLWRSIMVSINDLDQSHMLHGWMLQKHITDRFRHSMNTFKPILSIWEQSNVPCEYIGVMQTCIQDISNKHCRRSWKCARGYHRDFNLQPSVDIAVTVSDCNQTSRHVKSTEQRLLRHKSRKQFWKQTRSEWNAGGRRATGEKRDSWSTRIKQGNGYFLYDK